MIVGNGDLYEALKDTLRAADDRFIFFASGVSNSSETDKDEFFRERRLLLSQDETKHLVYFSSLDTFTKNSPYYDHKKHQESLVKSVFANYTIIRLGNITWGKNPHTFINNYKNAKAAGLSWVLKDEYRYVIEKEEFQFWIEQIPDWNVEMSIPGQRMKVQEALDRYANT